MILSNFFYIWRDKDTIFFLTKKIGDLKTLSDFSPTFPSLFTPFLHTLVKSYETLVFPTVTYHNFIFLQIAKTQTLRCFAQVSITLITAVGGASLSVSISDLPNSLSLFPLTSHSEESGGNSNSSQIDNEFRVFSSVLIL